MTDTTDWKAEAERLRAELYLAERNQAQLQAQRETELCKVRAELAQVREVLQSMEWMFLTDIPSDPYVCPHCGASQDEGHAPDCKLSAALAAKGE